MFSGRAVILFGTSHKYQYPGNPSESEFQTAVAESSCREPIRAIAEEMNAEGLAQKRVTHSIGEQVARSLSILHRYCDPGYAQRQALGIRFEQLIRVDGFSWNWTEGKITQAVETSHSIREQFWQQQLIDLDSWPVLFICGAHHVERFSKLLRKSGIIVKIAFNDWEPSTRS